MSYTYANRGDVDYSAHDRALQISTSARADRILERAEGSRTVTPYAGRVLAPATLSKMDKLAFVVAAIMTIGPLFAASMGALFYS